MKTNSLVFLSFCILALLVSSCQVIATVPSPNTVPTIDDSAIQDQIATMQMESTYQAATIESLTTQIPPTIAPQATETEVTQESTVLPAYSGEFKVIEADGFTLNLPLEVADNIMVSNVLPDDPSDGWPQFALPERRVISFDGYKIQNHFHKTLIYVYPLQKMIDGGQYGATTATNLQAVLDDPAYDLGGSEYLPFLPPFNAAQVFHVLEKRLESEHGRGIRYLTLYSQGFVGVTNYEIFYTYQGISADGRYYIAAILPINSSLLPDTLLSNDELDNIVDEYPDYIEDMTELIRTENGGIVTPSLEALDFMMMSLQSLN